MITHGTQRITDLRRGTWQITSMTRGTFDIFGTLFSPYSGAATAALQAAFPTQWETIRDYGWQHPEIVGYMNAYAVEDPKIAYSLVDGIGTRWLVGDGTAWFRTGLRLSTDAGIRIKADLSTIASASARLCGNNGNGYYFQVGVDNGRLSDLKVQVGAGSTEQFFALPSNRIVDLVVEGTPATVMNFDTVWSTTLQRRNPAIQMDDMSIFSNATNGTSIIKAKIALFDIWSPTAGTTKSNPSARYVPFIRSEQAECLDLITGTIAERHGSFTISETPSA